MAHSGVGAYQKNRFDREIDRAFGANADRAVENLSIEEVKSAIDKVPTLKKFYNKFIKKFGSLEMNYADRFHNKYDAITEYHSGTGDFWITFYRGSMANYRHLSQTILHEFGHVNSIYLGFLQQSIKDYGGHNGKSQVPVWIDEIYTYKFAAHHGGVPIKNNAHYDHYVNLLKGTSHKIIANEIILPTFD